VKLGDLEMVFDPKVVLALGVEGLSPVKKRSLARKWIVLVAFFMVLFSGTALLISKNQDLLILFGIQEPKKTTSGDMEVFRNMSFLPNVHRVEATNFQLKTLDGQNRTLIQDRGKVVLVNFWATWCPPCIREMPSMQLLYEKYKNQGFEIVAVSVDQGSSDTVRKFAEKLNLNFPIVLDPENTVKTAYRVRALPTNYLIDRTGHVVAWGMGARTWDGEKAFALIEHLLKEKG
jgi:peroxiredoxin